MIQPKISVVTVCYNAVNDIEKTILSVINQTYPNIEYIIIDGGSKDGTMNVVNKYKDKIDVVVSEPDKGIYDAMNKGARKSTGNYVQFLNAGDVLYDREVFSKLFSIDIADDVDVIYGDIIYVTSFGTFYKSPDLIENFKTTFPIAHPSSFVKRKCFDLYAFDTKYSIAADFALLKQLYDNGCKFHYCKEIPVSVFDSISGVSSKNIYQAWLEFNEVLGYDSRKSWEVRCFLKRISIRCRGLVLGLLAKLNYDLYIHIRVNKQLKNRTFKIMS